jgi:chitinase
MNVRTLARFTACVVVATGVVLAAGMPSQASWPRPDTTPPTAPTTFRVTAVSHTTVSLAWGPSTDNVGVISYSVWGEGATGLQSVRHPQTTATFTGLRPGTTQVFRIAAFDARNNASATVAVTVTTPSDTTTPSSPSGLTVRAVDGAKVLLQWTNAVDDFGPLTHQVLVNGAVTPNAWSTVPAGTPPVPAEGAWARRLEPGTTYQFAVRAVDGAGNVSGTSNTVTATTPPNGDTRAPTAPVLTSASGGGTSYCPEELWLRWTGSTDDVDATTAIEYEVRINGVINEVFAGPTRAIVYTEVIGPNEVTIVAVDRAGNASAPSNPITENVNVGVPCPT